MSRFQNTFVCQTVLWLLTGYFLISSLHINAEYMASAGTKSGIHSAASAWKRFFKAFKICAETEKSAEKDSKPVKTKISADFLIALETVILSDTFSDGVYIEAAPCHKVHLQEYYSRIPLPPPEHT